MGSPLNATVKSPTANSYLTVARANTILRRRLYTTAWDNASSTPDADGFLAATAATAGSTAIVMDTGSGTWTAGSIFKFSSHDQEYVVANAQTGAGTITFTPGLTQAVDIGDALLRQTASNKEKALMWATQLLDYMMNWFGTKRTNEQALWFPATGIIDENGQAFDYDLIPSPLEVATAEQAKYMLERDVFKAPSALGLGISEAQIGPLKAKIDSKVQMAVVPDNILSILSDLGVLEPEAQKGSMVLPLWRT